MADPVLRIEGLTKNFGGLRVKDDRTYEVLYGPLVIGWLDTFEHRFHRRLPRRLRP